MSHSKVGNDYKKFLPEMNHCIGNIPSDLIALTSLSRIYMGTRRNSGCCYKTKGIQNGPITKHCEVRVRQHKNTPCTVVFHQIG